jgi:putative transposase
MPRNVYWELFYHFVWRTKDSEPMLSRSVEESTHKYLVHRALRTPSAIVHAVGGIEDHVHLAASLPPTVEIAKWIGDLKGASAHEINHGPCGAGALAWQTGYGVVSFGKRDLPWVVEYVLTQREHHAEGRAEDRLERITEVEAPEGIAEEAR